MEAQSTTEESNRLRRCINDLASILALPAMWTGHACSRVTTTLLDALVRVLDLDFAYARTFDPKEPICEHMRSAENCTPCGEAHKLGRALEPYLSSDIPTRDLRIPNPFANGAISIAVLHIGIQETLAVLVVASRRSEFPTETESLLLQAATSQAAIALQEARRIAQREAHIEVERRNTKAALQQSEERLWEMADSIGETIQLIIDSTPAHIHTALPDGKIDFFNQTWLQYVGVPSKDLEGWKWTSAIHPSDVEGIVRKWRVSLASGEPFLYEARVRRADGEYRWMLHHKVARRDQSGKIVKWYGSSIDIEDRKRAEEEVKQLKDQLQHENVALREEVDRASMFEEIVGVSAPLRSVLAGLSKVAPTDSTVLIIGETGTGKELVARAIRKRSQRSARAFVSVNCAAIPRDLIGSELFGHERGAFTGATHRRLGRFELAEGGTIFLDEIGDLPLETQMFLLRVLQEREFDRIGGTGSIPTDVRVIAATSRNLHAAIAAGTFRSDLFYRLNVFPLQVPPLRERKEDIPLLVEYFIERYTRKFGKRIRLVNKKSLELLQQYSWPGNVRELQNIVERSVIVCDTDEFSVDHRWLSLQPVPVESHVRPQLSQNLASHEREIIETALRESRGRIFGPSGAAARLGVPRSTLESRIRSLKINKYRFKA